MTKAVRIKIEPMTEEAFRPFGELLAVKDRPPDRRGIGSDSWFVGFRTNGTTQVRAMRSRYQGLQFNKLERHFYVTQSFIPLGGSPAVVALVPPTDPDDREAIPTPDQVRAFLIDGTQGYLMKEGTWHSLDRYPLYARASNFIMLTDEETTEELSNPDKEAWKRTQEVDYEAKFGVVFELTL